MSTTTDPFKEAKQLRAEHPGWTAVQLGTELLSMFPSLPTAEMVSLLTYVGFSASEAESAVDEIYGTITKFVVDAKRKWQNTNVVVEPNQPTSVDYVQGKWTANPATGMVDADGNSSYIAKPGYTLPGAHEGALIGAVGKPGKDEGQVDTPYGPFELGNNGTVPQGQSGLLFLCINDDLDQRYGVGFDDNEGEIEFKILESKGVAS